MDKEIEAIENVSSSTHTYFKEHTWIVVVTILFSGLWIFYFLIFSQSENRYFISALPLVVILVIFGYIEGKMQHELMRQFAASIGFSYTEEGNLTNLTGTLFELGHSRGISDILTGSLNNFPIRFFTYNFSEGIGKERKIYFFSVCEINIGYHLPDILLAEPRFIGYSRLKRPGQKVIKLEGNFNEHFDLFVPEDFEIETFEIFTPDVMSHLIENAKGLEIEFAGTKIYIYEDQIMRTRQALANFYKLAEYFINRLGPTLLRLGDDIEAMKETTTRFSN